MSNTVRVEGLAELNRAFKLYGRGLEKGVREALEAASEPVKFEAQSLAASSLKRGKVPWSAMRIGVTKNTAYVAPVQRSTRTPGRGRPKLFDRLMNNALQPALDHNVANVERELKDALDDLGRMWSRV